MKIVMLSLLALFSQTVFAAPGFYCETNPGNRAFDGIYVSGTLDGEAQVSNLVANFAEGNGIEVPLEIDSIDLTNGFTLVAIRPLEDESTIIGIRASSINGKSTATFVFQNGVAKEIRTGICEVEFKAGN